MLHRKLSHALAAAALTGLWDWLAGLWPGTSSLQGETGDQGLGFDPNG
jgi:hypothetical protein